MNFTHSSKYIYRIFLTLFLAIAIQSSSAQDFKLPEGYTLLHNCKATNVKSQDRTGTCWSFSTSSFLESEIIRRTGQNIDISEMYTVRNIYVEKAERYLRYHGHRPFSQGSLAHDVFNAYSSYGMMPESAYPGKPKDSIHNHSAMEKELKGYLDTILATGKIDLNWKVGFNSILDKHLGVVPKTFKYNGKEYTARSFADEFIPIKPEEYVGITSFNHQPFDALVVVQVPDNFSDGKYYNIPLDDMMSVMNHALEQGYSVEWDGDVSETGFVARKGFAVLCDDTTMLKKDPAGCTEPKVNQVNRQEAFDQLLTTDDHLMHITGMVKNSNGKTFYLVKNSWSTKVGFEGYLLMSEAYMKMKTVSIYIHQGAMPENISRRLLN